ncbi:unnamed protein product [Diamesa serratosioi]
MIQSAGYQSEVYQVETEDGYILKVHRILIKNKSLTPKSPVFLMHGLGSTACDYVRTGPENALGFLLSDNGYDIWMGNSRGSKHSMHHRTLDVESNEFWDFSWHEIGYYDLKTMIDFMLTTTNHSKFYYIGYSQGTTASMVFLTTYPEYNEKIIQIHMIAPSVIFTNTNPITKLIATNIMNWHYKFEPDVHKLPQHLQEAKRFSTIFCHEQTGTICQNMLYLFFGLTSGEPEISTVSYFRTVVSTNQIIHYLQLVKSGKFQQFDHFEMNSKYYNYSEPPIYDLLKITVPVYLYHGQQDAWLLMEDIEKLKSILPNVRNLQILKNWNHVDLVLGKHTRKLLFFDILRFLKLENEK